MEIGPVYDLGHLVVAAVRVLAHRESRPPTPEAIGDLLGFSPEFTGQIIRGLEERGIVKTVKSAYDLRVEIVDHVGLEELPKAEKGPGMEAEIEEFEKRFKEKQEKLESLFGSDALGKKKKKQMRSMEDELKEFQKRRSQSPFEDEEGGDSE